MIRPAVPSDLPHLLAMGTRFLTDTAYAGAMCPNAEAMAQTAGWLMADEDRAIFVAEHAGTPIGMLGIACYPHPFSGEKTASELFWWMEPEHRGAGVRLLKTAERWARARGAARLQLVAPNRKVAAFYERLGFHEVEIAYDREL